jgi:AcrR family transcriptional regulator
MGGNSRTAKNAGRRFSQDLSGLARNAEMVQRILAGALAAATRRSAENLSMGEVAAAAGVSRSTVYRYFSSREAVLRCMSEQVRRRWELVMEEAIRAAPGEEQRVRVVMRSIVGMSELIPESKAIIERDPGYALAYLKLRFPDFVDTVVRALAPVTGYAAAVRAGLLDDRDVAEILLRIAMADFLMPGERTTSVSEQVDAFWSFVGGRVATDGSLSAQRARVPAVHAVSDIAIG